MEDNTNSQDIEFPVEDILSVVEDNNSNDERNTKYGQNIVLFTEDGTPLSATKDGKLRVSSGQDKDNPLPVHSEEVISKLDSLKSAIESQNDGETKINGSKDENPIPTEEVGGNVKSVTNVLYDKGTENIKFVDGFSLREDGATKKDDHIDLHAKSEGSGHEVSVVTDELLDFASFNKITIDSDFKVDGTGTALYNIYATKDKSERMGPGGQFGASGDVIELNHITGATNETIKIDVSGMSGEYYLGINAYTSASSDHVQVSNVKINKVTTSYQSINVSTIGQSVSKIQATARNGEDVTLSADKDNSGYGVLRTFQATPIEQTEEVHNKLDTIVSLLQDIKVNTEKSDK